MTDRERELMALLSECKGFLLGLGYVMPKLGPSLQSMIDKITAALAEPKEGSEAP